MGEQSVKNVATPVRAYRVRLESKPGARAGMITSETQPPRQKNSLMVAARIVVLVAVAAVVWGIIGRVPEEAPETTETLPPAPERPSITVLPFTNMSGHPAQEYFSDGITVDLITDLSQISGLFVSARSAVFGYKGAPRGPLASPEKTIWQLGSSSRAPSRSIRNFVRLRRVRQHLFG